MSDCKATVAKRIEQMMASQGVSKSELSRRLGVTPPYVQKILKGNENFSLGTLEKIAAALNYDLNVDLIFTKD